MFVRTLAIGAVVAVAAPAAAQMMPTPSTPTDYVKMASAASLFEQQEARVVLRSSTNPQIKAFATKMLADHGKGMGIVTAAAVKAGQRPGTPMLTAMQKQDLNKLLAAKGAARDRLYIEQQKPAHQMALQIHQYYAANGTQPQLKQAAMKIVPVVQSHISMLDNMPSM